MGNNSHPSLSFLQSFLSPDHLTSLPSPFRLLIPQPLACHPSAAALLILCCLFDFKQFPSNSCFQLRGRAVDILQARWWAGLGLSSWVMDDPRLSGIQLQGNNFCTGLWLWSETGGLHLTCPSAVFLVSYKRLHILLRWKCLFTLTKHWSSPNRKGSRPPSYGRHAGTQVFRHGTRVPIPLVKNKSSDFHVSDAVLTPLLSSPLHCWRLLSLEQNREMCTHSSTAALHSGTC